MDIRPHTCKKFMCGKETRAPWFAFGALVSPDYFTMSARICQYFFCFLHFLLAFSAFLCENFLNLAFLYKKYEKNKKMLDKES